MKTVVIPFLLFFTIFPLFAQTEAIVQKEIDLQIWKPFHDAFEARDAKALNALYAKEVLRVTPAGVDTEGQFKLQNTESYARANALGTKTALDFWFESRQTSEDTSYEVGIFRIMSTANGKTSTFYGQFHIVIKKINGQWKITQDWDSPNVNGKAITTADFSRKPALSF